MVNSPKAKILLVDDEPALLLSSRIILQQSGYEAATAADSVQARQLLQQNRFDLLLSDLGLERPDAGLKLLRWAHEQFPQMGCILLTGSADEDLKQDSTWNGIQVLFKPVQIPRLLEVIESLLRSRSRPDTSSGTDL